MGWFCNCDVYAEKLLARLAALGQRLFQDHSLILDELASLRRSQASILFLLRPPGRLGIQINGEVSVNVILFDVTLPPAAAPDVVKRELTVTVAGASVVHELPADTMSLAGLQGPQDANLRLSLVDIDDAGNRSPESTLDVVLLDTFAPPKPGDLGVTVTGELVIADPVEPAPEEPPVEPPVE